VKLPKIIGIAGTNGAGKDTLGELLAERCGYKFRSVSDILREELTSQGIPHEREHMRALSTRWADEHGHGVLSVKTIEAYAAEEEREGYKGLAIGSIRRPAEAKAVHEEGGLVIWIDADKRTRYDRIQANARGRSDDNHEFEEWSQHEDVEMRPIEGEPGSINMTGVKEIADIHIDNNFESFDAYRDYLIKEFEL
jgi:cytidylate kinase